MFMFVRVWYNGGKFLLWDISDVNYIICFVKFLFFLIIFLIKVILLFLYYNFCCWLLKFSVLFLFSFRLWCLCLLFVCVVVVELWNGGLYKVVLYCLFLWMMLLKIVLFFFCWCRWMVWLSFGLELIIVCVLFNVWLLVLLLVKC